MDKNSNKYLQLTLIDCYFTLMKSTTKLKKLLEKNVVAFSYSDCTWSVTVIRIDTSKRQNFTGYGNFSQAVHAAYASMFKKQKP